MSAYIEDAVSNFNAYCLQLNQVVIDRASLAGYGAIPEYPVIVVVDTDYTDVTAARDTWVAATDTVRQSMSFHYFNRILPQALLLQPYLAPNQWTGLTAATSGDFTPYPDTVWVGYVMPAPGIPPAYIVLTEAPTNVFPYSS